MSERKQLKTKKIGNRDRTRLSPGQAQQQTESSQPAVTVSPDDFSSRLELMKTEIKQNPDVVFRRFKLGFANLEAAVVLIDGLTDKDLINEIMKSLMYGVAETPPDPQPAAMNIKDFIEEKILPASKIKAVSTVKEAAEEVFTGFSALLIEGMPEILILETPSWKSRGMEEPVTEALVRGPRLGFNETLSDNISLLRRAIASPQLTFVDYWIGKTAKKKLVVAYMDGIVDPEIVREVQTRLERIDIDHVPESGYIEQLIEDNYLSPFPQLQNTERADRVASALLEGRVAILLDGTPFALIVPVTFSMLLQSPEDYYERWFAGSLMRMLRFAVAFVSLFGPSIYISFVSYHPGLIPTKLALSIAGTREGVPYPSFIEALIMEVAIEILREAGLRLPKPVGQTVGLVGGLVIGEAAVRAGIVSPIMVIVVSITAISSFAIPQYGAGIALRILRFGAMFFAALLGLYGVTLFFLLICIHFVKLKSFGVPYASPAVPYRLSDWKDFILRMPILMMKRRPKMLHTKNEVRKG
ncbi:spore germination protein [Lihuaxuella thermophila]|uniref:Spore germination protein n=1 Tax=Lihuaxuella thermophila TaxID=1173111 RepID=A0A1H8BI51_9BACL|nr:spore germination protein [Lihuaxuella thermophila]SEM81688.1 spore germination protein [Lihuaxuella thermophila]